MAWALRKAAIVRFHGHAASGRCGWFYLHSGMPGPYLPYSISCFDGGQSNVDSAVSRVLSLLLAIEWLVVDLVLLAIAGLGRLVVRRRSRCRQELADRSRLDDETLVVPTTP